MPTPSKSPALAAVQKAGRRLARINAQREHAIEDLRLALRAADAEESDGRKLHTRSQLVEAAGVARQTVYDALRDRPPAVTVADAQAALGQSPAGHGASEGDPAL